MSRKIDYLFIDPFASHKSGVTAYTKQAKDILSEHFTVEILSIRLGEPIEDFRKRVALFINNNEITIVEAPETRTASKYINHPRLHIRLHGSRTYCNYLQNLAVSAELIREEQAEINKAHIISAPSSITVDISRLFFDNLDNVVIIPNPIYLHNARRENNIPSDNSRKIFFIGRGDYLKGTIFLLKIIQKEPSLNITLVGDDKLRKTFMHHPNFNFIDGVDANLENLVNTGDIVLIPSIFETWSMVASEAILNRCQIVLWEHCGICQFIQNYKFAHTVPIWDINIFAQTIKNAISTKIKNTDIIKYSKQTIYEWNDCFLKNINGIIYGEQSSKGEYHPIKINLDKLLSIRNNESKFMRIKKKIKKFFRNPILFFKDSRYFQPVYLKIKKYNFILLKNKHDTIPIENKLLRPKIKKLDISPSGFIVFPEMDAKKAHLRTMILLPERYNPIAEELIPLLHRHKDFLPLRDGELIIYCYDDYFSEIEPFHMLEKLNNANRDRLSNIRNIFILDDTENFSLSLYHCNHTINVIQIIPKQKNNKLVTSNVLGYYLIHKDNINKLEEKPIRKTFIYDTTLNLSLYIRKVLQEILPRDINILLPVISSKDDYRIDLFKEKNRNYDIKIYLSLSKIENNNIKYHSELCISMANLTNGLYVTEQVFLKYQNLLVNPTFDNLANFYLYASKDGLYFDVECQ